MGFGSFFIAYAVRTGESGVFISESESGGKAERRADERQGKLARAFAWWYACAQCASRPRARKSAGVRERDDTWWAHPQAVSPIT